MERFVRAILARTNRRFLADLRTFADDVAFRGISSSLAQVVVKVCAPGVPDLYQGTELWSLALVDPDNRRPVDFDARSRMLAELQAGPAPDVGELASTWRDGRVKLWVTSQALRHRRAHPELFQRGSYLALPVTGPARSRVCAFARRRGANWVIAVVPRPHPTAAEEGSIRLPPSAPDRWTNVLTGREVRTRPRERLHLPDLMGPLPVAMLAGPHEG